MNVATTAPTIARCSVPVVRANVVERQRVQQRLHSGVGNGLIVVQAPAGYGKSTELSVFAAEVDYSIAWLSLDATSHNEDVFAQEIATAILGGQAWRPVSVARGEDVRAFVAATFRTFSGETDAPLMLVIDNAHELNGAPRSCDLLAWLVETLPEGYEIVLSGREPLPLSSVDRRIASGEAEFIAAEELAFTRDEVIRLCAERGFEGDPDAVFEGSRGWPIALAGILSGTVPLGDGAPTPLVPGAWDRYLISEVWAAVPEQLRTPMLLASVAPTLERDAALAVIGPGEWQKLRRWLEQRGFFSETVGGNSLRLNPSFQQFLRSELIANDYERAADAAAKVVNWLERSGRVADAIQVSMDLNVPGVLVGTLERHADSLMWQGATSLLNRAFEAVPAAFIPEDAPLNAIRLRVLAHVGFAEASLGQTVALLRRPHLPPETHFHALLAKIRCLRALGRGEEVTMLFRETGGVVEGSEPALLAEYYFMDAQNSLYVTADYDRADRLLKECHALAEQAGAMHLALLAQSARGDLLALRGESPLAVDELAQAASGWRRMGGVGNLSWVLNNLAVAYLAVGDTDSALAVLEEAQREAASIENERGEAFAVASFGDAYLALGNYEKAKDRYADAIRRSAEGVLDATLTVYSLIGLAAAELALGDIAQADFLAARGLELAMRGANPQEIAASELQLAAIRSAAGEHDTAERFASEALATLVKIGAANGARTARYRLCLCRFRAGKRAEAEEMLRELAASVTAPWMIGGLRSLVYENPMFAQWAASRPSLPAPFREALQREAVTDREPVAVESRSAFPRVSVRSLGTVAISVDGVVLPERRWTTARARELFLIFLSRPEGMRKEEAVATLFPDLPLSRCNSAFHSNLHRIRRALYRESIITREDGVYMLNPEGEFDWDVTRFLDQLARASSLPAGSPERADAYRQALALYSGPFAAEFYSEWAESLRERTSRGTLQAMSALAGFYAGQGNFQAAAEYLQQMLALDPYAEDAAHELALCQARAGNAMVAMGTIDEFGRRVDRELGQPLPSRLRELRSAIATGRAV